MSLVSAATSTSRGSRNGVSRKELDQFNRGRSKFVPVQARRRRPLSSVSRGTFIAVARFPCTNSGPSRFAGAPTSASLVMTDEILLQFEAIRLISGSLIALAIALAWLLAIHR